jgi:hypothetical protein
MESSFTFDDAARQRLRQAAALAGERRAGLSDLRQALEHPTADTPSTVLRANSQLRAVVESAAANAESEGTSMVGVVALATALAEAELIASGLDPRRLTHARTWVRQRYLPEARNRIVHRESVTS